MIDSSGPLDPIEFNVSPTGNISRVRSLGQRVELPVPVEPEPTTTTTTTSTTASPGEVELNANTDLTLVESSSLLYSSTEMSGVPEVEGSLDGTSTDSVPSETPPITDVAPSSSSESPTTTALAMPPEGETPLSTTLLPPVDASENVPSNRPSSEATLTFSESSNINPANDNSGKGASTVPSSNEPVTEPSPSDTAGSTTVEQPSPTDTTPLTTTQQVDEASLFPPTTIPPSTDQTSVQTVESISASEVTSIRSLDTTLVSIESTSQPESPTTQMSGSESPSVTEPTINVPTEATQQPTDTITTTSFESFSPTRTSVETTTVEPVNNNDIPNLTTPSSSIDSSTTVLPSSSTAPSVEEPISEAPAETTSTVDPFEVSTPESESFAPTSSEQETSSVSLVTEIPATESGTLVYQTSSFQPTEYSQNGPSDSPTVSPVTMPSTFSISPVTDMPSTEEIEMMVGSSSSSTTVTDIDDETDEGSSPEVTPSPSTSTETTATEGAATMSTAIPATAQSTQSPWSQVSTSTTTTTTTDVSTRPTNRTARPLWTVRYPTATVPPPSWSFGVKSPNNWGYQFGRKGVPGSVYYPNQQPDNYNPLFPSGYEPQQKQQPCPPFTDASSLSTVSNPQYFHLVQLWNQISRLQREFGHHKSKRKSLQQTLIRTLYHFSHATADEILTLSRWMDAVKQYSDYTEIARLNHMLQLTNDYLQKLLRYQEYDLLKAL
ncbi:PREDICTED: endochitinase A-like [Rhagoletis zephyria]|uniref:endochitinase A-like n=1 Tax=Rhagoletis zephyria TaxID=28612 RepID=UPI0008116AF7|nr:PREDICTED: endochitinase A-like [Rhagoletis zephyria]